MPLLKASPDSTSNRNVDIWLAYEDDLVDEQQLAGLRLLLSRDEVEKERRFKFADVRKRHLIARAMVRMVLSRYALIAPEDWEFSENAYGRPEIADAIVEATVDARGLSFNLSHTQGLIALAVTRGRSLGIDVENTTTRSVSLKVAQRCFSPSEAAELAGLPVDRQQGRFFDYWTLKESYIKARGMGLSMPLDRFSFRFPQRGKVGLDIDPELQDHGDRWSFW